MPTDYLHMPHQFRTNEPLIGEHLNKNIMPVVDRYNAGMGPHNMNVSLKSAPMPVATEARAKLHHLVATVDPGLSIASTGYPTPSGSGPDAVFQIENNMEWQLITNSSGSGDDMQLSLTLGGSAVFRVWGWLQYARDLFGSAGSPEAQFALRIDGAIVPFQFTGFQEEEPNFHPTKISAPKSFANPYPPSVRRSERSTCPGAGMHPICFVHTFQLGPGEHTIELVARRNFLDLNRSRAGNECYVYTRKLVAVEIPMVPVGSSGAADLSVPPFEAEDVVSKASLGTSRITLIKNAHNGSSSGLQEGSVRRGAFNNRHIPSAIMAKNTVNIVPNANETIRADYPGFTSDTVSGSKTSGTGWYPLDSTTPSANLQLDNGSGAWQVATLSTDASFIVVVASVWVRNIANHGAPANIVHGQFGALALGYYSNSTHVIMDDTIAFVNNHNHHSVGGTGRTEINSETRVTLVGVVDVRTSALANDIDRFDVYGSVADSNGGTANGVRLVYRNANIAAFQVAY